MKAVETLTAVLLLAAAAAQAAVAAEFAPNERRGLAILRLYCSRCHAIDKLSPSPLSIAPPFRTLHKRYPVETLDEALAEGIVTGHPSMPEFAFDPGQVGDIIAYLKTLER